MKKSTKNTLLFILLLIIIAVIVYFYWQSQQVPIDGSITDVKPAEKVENIDETKEEIVEAFNLPAEVGDHQIIERPYYTLSYNNDHEQADWVAYTIYPFPDSISVKRKDAFRPDPLVEGGSATLADYTKSGYDRGHLAPAKALSYSKESMSASFFLSNMSPQVGIGFNRGIWRFLEAEVYKWSKKSDSLYVVSGPVLDNPLGTIGESKVSIPRSYYKTIVCFKDGEVTGIGFLLKNEKTKDKFFKYATSIDSIEQVTGIDFYQKMDDALEAKIEANKEISEFIKPIN